MNVMFHLRIVGWTTYGALKVLQIDRIIVRIVKKIIKILIKRKFL